MASRITARYTGELRTELVHEKSGATLITDAPTDNHGKGEAFSPTDLLAAGALSCMLTVIGIAVQNDQLPEIAAMNGSVEKQWGAAHAMLNVWSLSWKLPACSATTRSGALSSSLGTAP